MPNKKRTIIFASQTFTLANLFTGALEKTIGLECINYVTGSSKENKEIEESLPNEIETTTVECVVLATDPVTKEEATVIYEFWRKHLPNTPFVWCHCSGSWQGDWAPNPDWQNVIWIDVEVGSLGNKPYDLLIKALNKIAD